MHVDLWESNKGIVVYEMEKEQYLHFRIGLNFLQKMDTIQ